MVELCGMLSLLCLTILVLALFTKSEVDIAKAIKLSFYTNLVVMGVMLVVDESEMLFLKWEWIKAGNYSLVFSFRYDMCTCCFFVVALYVTWNILVFSLYYMATDPRVKMFCKYLAMFLIAMLLLTSAESLFQLLIGWEGVGIMSYLLISWWYSRSDANTAALQAIFYNRVGDIGLIIVLVWSLFNINDWSLTALYQSEGLSTFMLFGVVLAAAGKSAQLGLHPWLPAAMEGPTPVSSLLHSSTMVVAGVFLLIRFNSLILVNFYIQGAVFLLGSMTTLFSAFCALSQNDMKKVVAFSTASQLGLMVTAVGAGVPQLAFLHICMHAFFKAMLFMCSGGYIHGLQNEQDIRKMGSLVQASPVVSVCLLIGSAALMGAPFLSGFFSKDPIIEAINMSSMNSWGISIVLVATMFTAGYSSRLFYYSVGSQNRMMAFQPLQEDYKTLIKPLQRLGYGSIVTGIVFVSFVSPITPSVLSLPLNLKIAAIAVTLVGGVVAWDTIQLLHKSSKVIVPYLGFGAQVGYYSSLVHFTVPSGWLNLGETIQMKVLDRGWIEQALPQGISSNSKLLSELVGLTQTSLIKMYVGLILLILSVILLVLLYL
uniref:NADH-ubiquinone oxidoreductase chain 5 n=1 Tax=Epigonichthys maldivensis TaxID=231028 RepID=A0A182C2T3_9BRAN|nr:NADH dehydrogenase subunit 5 [Epigonichthys maldivensis]